MDFNQLFTIITIILPVVFVGFIIKTIKETWGLKKVFCENTLEIEQHLKLETLRLKNNNQHIELLEDFHQNLINRLFTLNKEFIVLHKLILELLYK